MGGQYQVQNLIAGLPAPALAGETLPVIDPSFGAEFSRMSRSRAEDIDVAVKAARRAYDTTWSRMSALERGRLLTRLGGLVLEGIEELGGIESRDTGKPLKQGRADATACARYFEFYGGAADKIHGETIPYLDGYTVLAQHEPYGVTGHIRQQFWGRRRS